MKFLEQVTKKKLILYLDTIMAEINTNTKELLETDVLTDIEKPCHLIVWNDEVNTFDWVIQTLVEICSHSEQQAEQCAMIIHTKGKYSVKEGDIELLKPMCEAITERGIGATIEILTNH